MHGICATELLDHRRSIPIGALDRVSISAILILSLKISSLLGRRREYHSELCGPKTSRSRALSAINGSGGTGNLDKSDQGYPTEKLQELVTERYIEDQHCMSTRHAEDLGSLKPGVHDQSGSADKELHRCLGMVRSKKGFL